MLCLWSKLEHSAQFWPPELKKDVTEIGGIGKRVARTFKSLRKLLPEENIALGDREEEK